MKDQRSSRKVNHWVCEDANGWLMLRGAGAIPQPTASKSGSAILFYSALLLWYLQRHTVYSNSSNTQTNMQHIPGECTSRTRTDTQQTQFNFRCQRASKHGKLRGEMYTWRWVWRKSLSPQPEWSPDSYLSSYFSSTGVMSGIHQHIQLRYFSLSFQTTLD